MPDSAAVAFRMSGFCCEEAKPFAPVQLYVAPATVAAFRKIVSPSQTCPVAEATGAAGAAFTETVVVAAALVQPFAETFTAYAPAEAAVAITIGLCRFEVKPFGPVQLYVAPLTLEAVRLTGVFSQTELVLLTVGAAGILFTVAETVAANVGQPFSIAYTLYVPFASVSACAMMGFWSIEPKPFGPDHKNEVAPETAEAKSLSVSPAQIAPPVVAAGAACAGIIVTETVSAGLTQPLSEAVT